MKNRALIISILILILSGNLNPVFALSSKSEVLQNAATTNGNGTASSTSDFTSAVIQVSGTFAATINFEASLDGTSYSALQCSSLADRTSLVTTTTVSGMWRCNIISIAKFRARISGYGSGSVTVKATYNSVGIF